MQIIFLGKHRGGATRGIDRKKLTLPGMAGTTDALHRVTTAARAAAPLTLLGLPDTTTLQQKILMRVPSLPPIPRRLFLLLTPATVGEHRTIQ